MIPSAILRCGPWWMAWLVALAVCALTWVKRSDASFEGRLEAYTIAAESGSVAPPGLTEDPFYGARWGVPPASAPSGVICIVTGHIKASEPFRLWFFVPHRLILGKSIELDEDDATQLTIGDPVHYVSHRVEVTLTIDSDGETAQLLFEADSPELDQKRFGEFELEGPIAVAPSTQRDVFASESLPPRLLPRTDFEPTSLWNPLPGRSPPPGYMEQRRSLRWLTITGALVFSSTYVASIAAINAIDPHYTWHFAVPVVGPMWAGVSIMNRQSERREGAEGSEADLYLGFLTFFGTFGVGVVEALGIAATITGLSIQRTRWIKKDSRFALSPMLTHEVQGMSLRITY